MIKNIVVERLIGDTNDVYLVYHDYPVGYLNKNGSIQESWNYSACTFNQKRYAIQTLKRHQKVLGISNTHSNHDGLNSTVFRVEID